jgi:hypothetical protein
VAWALLGLTVVLVASSVGSPLTGGEAWNQKFATIPVVIAFAVVGALVAARTGNRLGWLFLAAGTAGAVSLAVLAYAARAPADQLPGAAWAGWIVNGAVEPAHISVWTASNRAPLISSSPAGRRR